MKFTALRTLLRNTHDSAWTVVIPAFTYSGIILFVVVLFAGLGLALFKSYVERDDSDPPNGHSQLIVRRDHLTGCEYLETSQGGIAPRLDLKGRHICRVNQP